MGLSQIINQLEAYVENPTKGLPEEVFLFVSRITPLINVDLLIKNDEGKTLLTWRDDGWNESGWHVPGGIIRYKETAATRIKAVAAGELGAEVIFADRPMTINEIILPLAKNRAHAVSLLYKCTLAGSPQQNLRYKGGVPKIGEWAWFISCPKNLISVHDIYRPFIGNSMTP